MPSFPILRTVSHVSNWSILVTTMLWHSGNSWPTFLVAKLWLAWARAPGTADSTLSAACGYVGTAGNGWIPLLCSENMTQWDWEGVQSAHVTELLSGFPWNAQKSRSKEPGQQSNLHVRNVSINMSRWRFTGCFSGLVFFSTVFWIMKSELIRAMDSSKWNENRSFCLRRGDFVTKKKKHKLKNIILLAEAGVLKVWSLQWLQPGEGLDAEKCRRLPFSVLHMRNLRTTELRNQCRGDFCDSKQCHLPWEVGCLWMCYQRHFHSVLWPQQQTILL